MDRFPLNILLVDDDPEIRLVLQSAVEEVQQTREDVEFFISQAGSIDEAIESATRQPPLLVVTDLNLPSDGRKQTDLLEFLGELRRSLTTFNAQIVVVSGMLPSESSVVGRMTLEQRDLLRRFRELRVGDAIPKPFDFYKLVSRIDSLTSSILDQRTTSTGLFGRTEADRLLSRVLETDEVPTVAIMLDLRKIGLSANDRFGREFGNRIIDLFAKVSTTEIGKQVAAVQKKTGVQLEYAQFQLGGDEFAIILRARDGLALPGLIHDAEWLGRAIQVSFRKEVQQMYPKKFHSEYGLLVGPGVVNKTGQHVVLPLPSPRIAILPFYPGLYGQLADIAAVELSLQAEMKREENATEAQANAFFRLPAKEFPMFPKGELQQLLQMAHRSLSRPKDMWTANFALTNQILHQRTKEEK